MGGTCGMHWEREIYKRFRF